MAHARPSIKPVADSALLVEFDKRIHESISQEVLALLDAIERSTIDGIIEAVPSYCTLLVYYDPLRIGFEKLTGTIEGLCKQESAESTRPSLWEVPVWYGGPMALDLQRVADHNGLSAEQIINIHSEGTYRVYLVGFAPGWTFLGGLDERLHTPRLETPRAEVPAGSISIAGQQGLICGPAMPSGWNLIGLTPERTWAPAREEPFFIKPGDIVRIKRVDEEEFQRLDSIAASGKRVSRALPVGAASAATGSTP